MTDGPRGQGGLGIDRLGTALLVWRAPRPSDSTISLTRGLPSEPGRNAVVVDPAALGPDLWPRMLAWLGALPPAERASLRLVAPGAGAGASAGQPGSPAQWLAEQLGAEIVAPDGIVLPTAGGLVFVAGAGAGGGGGGWWAFRPGALPAFAGLRHPTPHWEPALPPRQLRSATGMVAEPVPAGIWVHVPDPAASGPPALGDPSYALPPDPARVAIVVGGPYEPPVNDRELRELLAAIPDSVAAITTVLPYHQIARPAAPALPPPPPPAPPAPAPPRPGPTAVPSAPAPPPVASSVPVPPAEPLVPPPEPSAGRAGAVAAPTPPEAAVPGAESFVPIDGGVRVEATGWVAPIEEMAPWWRPDAGLFTVVVRFDRETGSFHVGDRRVLAPEFGEVLAAAPGWGRLPVLLVSDQTLAGWVVQQIADSLQVAVAAGPQEQGRWWALLPRRAEWAPAQVRSLGAAYPFPPDLVAALAEPPPAPSPAPPTDGEPDAGAVLEPPAAPLAAALWARLERWQRADWRPGRFGVAARRDPSDRIAPYRQDQVPWTTWDLANALWSIREQWYGSELVLLVDGEPGGRVGELRLLANHLDTPVSGVDGPLWSTPDRLVRAAAGVWAAPAGGATVAPVGMGAGRWFRVEPRTGPVARQRRPAVVGGRSTGDSQLDALLRQSAPGPVYVSRDGLLIARGGFRRYEPAAGTAPAQPVPERPGIRHLRIPHPAEMSASRPTTPMLPPPLAPPAVAVPPRQPGQPPTAVPPAAPSSAAPPPAAPAPVAPPAAPTAPGPAAPPPAAPATAPGAPPEVLPAPAHLGIQPTHRSTPEERRHLRAALEGRYDTHARTVSRLLSQRPGLRASGDPEEAVVTDLVAVRAYLAEWSPDLDASLRAGTPTPDPTVACIVSGLRRLASHRGATFRGGELTPTALEAYQTGAVMTERAFVLTTASRTAGTPGDAEYVIWSATGRRAAGLDVPDDADSVVFAINLRFKVLDVAAANDVPARVFLRELPAIRGDEPVGGLTDDDRTMLGRLREAVAARDEVPANQRPPFGAQDRPIFPLGLDDAGRPFPLV